MTTMTPFSLSGFLAGVSSLAFGFLVLFKTTQRNLGRMWFLFSLSAAAWGFGGTWIGSIKDPISGLFAWRLTYAFGVIWIAPVFYHFVCVFLEHNRKKSIASNYLLGLAFTLTIPTRLFFSHADFVFNQFCYARGGAIYPFYFSWWIGLVIFCHVDLIRSFKSVSAFKRNQIQYFFLAICLGFVGGSLCYLPNFGIDVYPWGNFSVMFYPLIMTYSILRHNLMDVRIFVRRAVLLVGVYALLIISVAPFLFHSQNLLSTFIVAGILSVGPFIYAHLIRRSVYFQEHTMAGITHELKSPLAAIESALSILQEKKEIGTMPREQLDSYLEMIQRNSERLTVYVNDLLQVFRSQGKNEIILENDVNLNDVIDAVLKSYQGRSKASGIEILESLPADIIAIRCDRSKISLALSNLINNAIKFSSGGRVRVHLRPSEAMAIVSVQDEGSGIPSDELPFVFDRFYQGSVGRGKKGSGLGLSIAKIWVEAHGGKIWAESEGEGKGTKVTFTLSI